MDPVWLMRNTATAWRRSAGFYNFVRYLTWIYGPKLGLAGREFTISLRYPNPLGEIHLCLRVNRGADAFILGEVFEHGYYRLPFKIPPSTVLDLGANIGLTAIYFARQFPRSAIACVEPFPANIQLLDRNLHMNAIEAQVFPVAIDIQDGYVSLERHKYDYGHRIVNSNTAGAGELMDVPTITIPTLMKRMGWDRIGLLKVDIEGHEKVLFSRDCDWLNRVDAICIEWHGERLEAEQELTAIAHQFGFTEPKLLSDIWFMDRAT